LTINAIRTRQVEEKVNSERFLPGNNLILQEIERYLLVNMTERRRVKRIREATGRVWPFANLCTRFLIPP